MKILFVDQSGNLYGSERGLLTLLSNPPLSEFEAIVACPGNGRLWEELLQLDISMEKMEFNAYSWRQRPQWQLKFLTHFLTLIRKYQPDAIVINFEGNVPLMVLAGRLMGCPVIRMLKREVRSQISDPQGDRMNLTDRLSFLGSHGVICISGTVEKQLHRALGVGSGFPSVTLFDPQELTVISQDDIQRRRQQLGIAPDELVVGEFARIHPVKGIDILIKAAPIILQHIPQARFLIVGDPDNQTFGLQYQQQLQELTHNLGVANQFTWVGFVPDPLTVMASCDVVTLPTRAEGLGRVLIEAWSVGCPVVASQIDGPEEIIRLSGGGLLHPVEDSDALAHQLLQLLSSSEERSKLGRLGQEWVGKNCNPAFYRSQFLASIKKFLQ